MKSLFFTIIEIAEVVLIAFFAVFLIRNFLFKPFLVNGASMEPNFSSGDYLLVDEIIYRFREPQRGEVIVFRYPGDESVYYIKRIIGLPGEKINIKQGEILIFNEENSSGFLLEENYLPLITITSGEKEFILNNNEYFVLGDNRHYSSDSRNWGSLNKAEIVGLARLRLWPFNKAIAVEKPIYEAEY